MSRAPAVSVLLSTHNGERFVERALGSALAQRFEDFEVVVVDDASRDGTVAWLSEVRDPRVRVVRNEVNLGEYATWNRCLRLARGRLVKFLCQDDALDPDCLGALAAPFDDPAVGLAFARRRVMEGSDAGEAAQWEAVAAAPLERLGGLDPVTPGPELVQRILRRGFAGNPFGEPTSVMARRSVFARTGGFSTRPRQMGDFEMWLRLAWFSGRVAFVDRVLSEYRVHGADGASVTAVTKRTGRDWLDELWIVEGLLAHDEIRRGARWLHALRAWESAAALRRAVRRRNGDGAAEYARYRAARLRGRAPALHPPVTAA